MVLLWEVQQILLLGGAAAVLLFLRLQGAQMLPGGRTLLSFVSTGRFERTHSWILDLLCFGGWPSSKRYGLSSLRRMLAGYVVAQLSACCSGITCSIAMQDVFTMHSHDTMQCSIAAASPGGS